MVKSTFGTFCGNLITNVSDGVLTTNEQDGAPDTSENASEARTNTNDLDRSVFVDGEVAEVKAQVL